jgi:hypothetical protein
MYIAIIIGIIVIIGIIFIITSAIKCSRNNKIPKYEYDTIKNTVDFIYKNLYCGLPSKTSQDFNQGPAWKNKFVDNCKQGDGQQAFWLSGNNLETLVNYSRYTKTSTYIPPIISKLPQTLQTQLLSGYNGVYNDDKLWFVLSFISIYEYGLSISKPDMFKKQLIWAAQVYHDIYTKTFNNFTCANLNIEFETTWWQTFTSDPTGINTYRNTITNLQLLEVGLRLYNNIDASVSDQLYTKDKYYSISTKLVYFIQKMILPNGLVCDGIKKPDRKSNSDPSNCELSQDYYTYAQGIAIDSFTNMAVIAFDRKDIETYNNCIEFTMNLIKLMTLTPKNNITISNTKTCNLNIAMRKDCNGPDEIDKEVCTNSGCCFDSSNILGNWCYKPVSPPVNNLLTTVGGISILTENNNDQSNDSHAFKGIFVRYLGYSLKTLKLFFDKNTNLYLDVYKNIIERASQFLLQNLNWVLKNCSKNFMYAGYWELDSDNIPVKFVPDSKFTTGSTFSVVDLFNTCVLLNWFEK